MWAEVAYIIREAFWRRLGDFINEKPVLERLYFKLFPHEPRHGVNCTCNCGNWQAAAR